MNDDIENKTEMQSTYKEVEETGIQNFKNVCGSNAVVNAGSILGNTAAGLGIGVVAGIGIIIATSVAEVAVPAILVLKAFGLTGGAIGFLRGIKKK